MDNQKINIIMILGGVVMLLQVFNIFGGVKISFFNSHASEVRGIYGNSSRVTPLANPLLGRGKSSPILYDSVIDFSSKERKDCSTLCESECNEHRDSCTSGCREYFDTDNANTKKSIQADVDSLCSRK